MNKTCVVTLIVSLVVVVSHHSNRKKPRTSTSAVDVLRDCVVESSHVCTWTEKHTQKIRAVENGPTDCGTPTTFGFGALERVLGQAATFCVGRTSKDSPGSRSLATACCAVQEKEDERRWRPAQERRTDGSEAFTCAHLGFEEKRARREPNSVCVAVCSTLCSVENFENAG